MKEGKGHKNPESLTRHEDRIIPNMKNGGSWTPSKLSEQKRISLEFCSNAWPTRQPKLADTKLENFQIGYCFGMLQLGLSSFLYIFSNWAQDQMLGLGLSLECWRNHASQLGNVSPTMMLDKNVSQDLTMEVEGSQHLWRRVHDGLIIL